VSRVYARLTPNNAVAFVATCWIGQIFKHFPEPKPSYVADWDQLPQWQQETDADIFERIEQDAYPLPSHDQGA